MLLHPGRDDFDRDQDSLPERVEVMMSEQVFLTDIFEYRERFSASSALRGGVEGDPVRIDASPRDRENGSREGLGVVGYLQQCDCSSLCTTL